MRYFYLLIISMTFLVLISGCTATQRAAIDPPSIGARNRSFSEKVVSEKTYVTPKHRIIIKSNKYGTQRVISEVDKQASEYLACMGSKTDINKLRAALIYIVDTVFECEYHRTCGGELCRSKCEPDIIIVSYDVFGKGELLPLLKHEWAHLDYNYKNDHSNMNPELKKCIKYE
ncbi:MAG: hypothetical protein ACRENO_03300 [Thermodesulfobacteriota bacterium]